MTNQRASSARDTSGRVVAVTGAGEFPGNNLIARLDGDDRYRKVVALDLREPPGTGRKTVFCPVDLTAPEAGQELVEIFKAHQVDNLAHLAFLPHPIYDTSFAHELQVIGTMHVLNAAAAARVKKVVMLSSTMVYGAHPGNPNFLKEEHPLRGVPGCSFVNDLLEAEGQLIQFSKKNPRVVTTQLRMASMVGDRADGLIPRLLSGSTVPTVMGYDPLLQFLHHSDALEALKLAVDHDHRGAFNIVAEGVLPLSTVLRLAGRIPLPIPHILWKKAGGLLWIFQALRVPLGCLDYLRYLWVADGERARREMGFVPKFTTREALLHFLRPAPPSSAEHYGEQ